MNFMHHGKVQQTKYFPISLSILYFKEHFPPIHNFKKVTYLLSVTNFILFHISYQGFAIFSNDYQFLIPMNGIPIFYDGFEICDKD